MENEGAYRAVLYTCVAAHWITLLTAVAVVGTHSITPLAVVGALFPHIPVRMRLPVSKQCI